MKRSEKMLAAGLLATLGLWQGSSLFKQLVIAPVEKNDTEIAALQDKIAQKKRQLNDSRAKAKQFAEWKKRSLPPDPVDATSLYQNWLIELATRTKLTEVSVTARGAADFKPKADSKADTFHLISAQLKAQGTLEKVRNFLYEFRAAGLLHRVSKISLSSKQHTGDPVLDIDLTVEGLSLKDAPPRSTLFSDPKLADLPSDKPAKALKDYDVLVKKNLFVRGYSGPSKPAAPLSPEEDPLQYVRLVGSFSNGDSFDATMYDPANNRETRLTAGKDFRVADREDKVVMEGRVVSVGIDFVVLSIKGETFRLELGDNLKQLKKLSAAETSG